MGDIVIKEVLTRRDRCIFINLPSKVHKDDHNWLPPIYMDERELYNKKKNKSYNYADALLLLAYRGKKPMGRIMGIINNRYNEIHNEQDARFCFMECFNDAEVFHALIKAVEDWARGRGMKNMIGPLGFSDKDPQGFLIEGFDYPAFITSATNLPYLPELLEKEGYAKKVDLVDYLADMPKQLPPVYERVLSRLSNNNEYKVIEFETKKELRKYIIPILELMNETFMEIYGFVPLNDKEKIDFAERYLPILDPKFIKVVQNHKELIGFAVGMPDISPAIKAINGRLLPFGIFRVLKESKRSKKLLMVLGGVKKAYRGQGIDVLMGVKILESGIKHQMEVIDSHLVLETNTSMRGEYERVGGRIVKKFRIYQKSLG